jgi:ATP-binding cassette subfamily F protein 3
VETNSLNKSYGTLRVLTDINFAIERNDKIAFVGKNGEGKSTLSRIIAGIEPYEGNLTIGTNVQIGYYAQHQSTLFNPDFTVFDIIDSEATGDARPYVRSILGAFMFSGDSVNKKVKVLSGGEKSRLSLARLMLKPANLLILDEPTNHLDMAAKDVLKKALINYQGSLIIVSHDREFLEGLTNRTVVFKNNSITEYLGDINYYLEKSQLENLRQLESKVHEKTIEKSETITKSQLDRDVRKSIQRDLNKFTKDLENIEVTLEKLETDKNKYEELFSNPEIYKNIPLLTEYQIKHKNTQESIDELYIKWDLLTNQIEELNSKLK